MADFSVGDTVKHRFNPEAVGEIIEIRTTSNPEFRLLRVRWTTGPVLHPTWETEDNLTIAGD